MLTFEFSRFCQIFEYGLPSRAKFCVMAGLQVVCVTADIKETCICELIMKRQVVTTLLDAGIATAPMHFAKDNIFRQSSVEATLKCLSLLTCVLYGTWFLDRDA